MKFLVYVSLLVSFLGSSLVMADRGNDRRPGIGHGDDFRRPPPRPPVRPNPPRPNPPPYYPPRPTPPPPPRPTPPPPHGGLFCRADDAGHEEHRSHGSCRECLSYHGQCIETCERYTERHNCRVDGRNQYGQVVSFTGYGYSRWDAERDATYQCQRAGYSCSYAYCNVEQLRDVVSRNYCR